MGFGPMKSTLDAQSVKKVSTFAFLFYLSSFIYETGSLLYSQFRIDVEENRTTLLTTISEVLQFNSYIFVFAISLPIIIMDSVLFMWIFTSMNQTMEDLKRESQTLKLGMYKRFVSVLTLALELGVLLSLAQAIQFFFLSKYSATHHLFEWTTAFGFESFWKIGFVVLLVATMLIWRPTKHNQLYASSMQLPQNESDDKMMDGALETIDQDDEELQEMVDGELKKEFKLDKNDVKEALNDSDDEMKIEKMKPEDDDSADEKQGLKMRIEKPVENKK